MGFPLEERVINGLPSYHACADCSAEILYPIPTIYDIVILTKDAGFFVWSDRFSTNNDKICKAVMYIGPNVLAIKAPGKK